MTTCSNCTHHSLCEQCKFNALKKASNEGAFMIKKEENNKGLKYDTNKPPLELLCKGWLEGTANVLGFGAKKYARHNWTKGIEYSRLMGAALRHLMAFNSGEDTDSESGLSHLYHASCCLMFLSEMQKLHPELDDRYKAQNND